ncbi:unnamed protein product, partial [Rotaria sordida]
LATINSAKGNPFRHIINKRADCAEGGQGAGEGEGCAPSDHPDKCCSDLHCVDGGCFLNGSAPFVRGYLPPPPGLVFLLLPGVFPDVFAPCCRRPCGPADLNCQPT